jgi:hypothetical protein
MQPVRWVAEEKIERDRDGDRRRGVSDRTER